MTAQKAQGLKKALLWVVVGVLLGGCDLIRQVPVLPPDRAPLGVTATMADLENAIEVRWLPVERATTYEVYRAEQAGGSWTLVGTPSDTVFQDPTPELGKLYWYKVRACNSVACGPESAVVVGYAGRPPAPQNVQASTNFPDRIVVTWDPVPGATYYTVYRDRAPDGEFNTIVDPEVRETEVEDTEAMVGLRYWYKVRACRDLPGKTVCSSLSEAASGCRAPCLPLASEE